jgi:hypothetical protein
MMAMTVPQFQKAAEYFLAATPFEPFVIVSENDERHTVTKPQSIAYRDERVIAIKDEGGFAILNTNTILRLEYRSPDRDH